MGDCFDFYSNCWGGGVACQSDRTSTCPFVVYVRMRASVSCKPPVRFLGGFRRGERVGSHSAHF